MLKNKLTYEIVDASTIGIEDNEVSLHRILPVTGSCLCAGTYNLHPTPYTLHPTPFTLHPAPCTLHPTPVDGRQGDRVGVAIGAGGLLAILGIQNLKIRLS